MNRDKAKDIAVRAGKTFLQAFLGAISIDTVMATPDRSVWKSMLLGAVAAGISAVMNYVLSTLKEEDSDNGDKGN